MVRRRFYRTRPRRSCDRTPHDMLDTRAMCMMFCVTKLQLGKLIMKGEIPAPTESQKGVPYWWYKDVEPARLRLEKPQRLPARRRNPLAP